MTGLLVCQWFLDTFGDDLVAAAAASGLEIEPIVLPADPEARLSDEECARIEVAFHTSGMYRQETSRSFFSSLFRAPKASWMHVHHAGVDHPIFGRMLERGIRITNSSGASAEPIAQTAIAGLLALSRGLPGYADAQRRHAWETVEDDDRAELLDQTIVVYGLGEIGSAIARIARAIGLHVVGVRRSPARDGDPVDELRHPDELAELLPRADWLAIAAPLTEQTRGLFDAAAFAAMPRGAHIINVGRGQIVDEAAMIEALRSGQLGGAYLDVFEEEPLPAESSLWDMPGVIITPHNSSPAPGNDRRGAEIFFENLGRWARGEPLRNEVIEAGS